MAAEDPTGWDAFISYSRQDKDFVVRLAAALNAYQPPKAMQAPARRLRVFLDQHDLGTGDYAQEIETQLARSRMLILVCTPAARASPYVDDEVQRFVRLRGPDAVVPVLLAGLANNEAAADQAERRAFPPALAAAMEMPLAVDYRGFDVRRDRVQRGVFEGPWHQLLAKLLGVARAEVEQREKRRQLVRWRWIGGGAAALVAVLATAAALTLLARSERERQRELAEQRRRDAQAQALNVRAEAALAEGGQGWQRALLLSVESLASAWTPEAQALLLAQIDHLLPPPAATATDQRGPILAMVPLPGQGLLASQGVDRLWLRSAADLKPVRDLGPLRTPGGLRQMRASADGRWLLAGCADAAACVWDTRSWQVAWKAKPAGALIAAAFSPDGRRLALAFQGPPQVQLVEAGAWADQPPLAIDEGNSEPVQALAFAGDADTLLVRTRSDLELHTLRAPRRKLQEVDTRGGHALVLLPQPGALLVDDSSRRLRPLRLERDARGVPSLSPLGEPVGTTLDTRAQTSVAGDGTVAARTADRMVQLLLPQGGAVLHAAGGSAITLVGDGRLAVGQQEGAIELFDPQRAPVLRLTGDPASTRLALSRDGQQLAITGPEGTTRVLALADGRPNATPATLVTLQGPAGAQPHFTPGGQWLLLVSSEAVTVVSTADWRTRWQKPDAEMFVHLWVTPDDRWLLLQREGRLERIALAEGRAAPPIELPESMQELRVEPGGQRIAGYAGADFPRGVGLRYPSMRRVWQLDDGRALGWRSFERDDLEKKKGITWGRRTDDARGEWTQAEGGGDLALVDAAAGWPLVAAWTAWPAAPAAPWLLGKDAAGKALHEHALRRAERAQGKPATGPAWSADGHWLATLGADGAVQRWPVAPPALAAEACARLRRNLDSSEWRTAFGDQPYRRTCTNLPPAA